MVLASGQGETGKGIKERGIGSHYEGSNQGYKGNKEGCVKRASMDSLGDNRKSTTIIQSDLNYPRILTGCLPAGPVGRTKKTTTVYLCM